MDETIYVNYEDDMNCLKDKLEQYVNKISNYSDNSVDECIDYLIDKYECYDINDDLIYGDEGENNEHFNIGLLNIYLLYKTGSIEYSIKCLIIWFSLILNYFCFDYLSIEIKTKKNNYIYKKRCPLIEKQEKDLENNIKKDISKTDIRTPKSYSTKIEGITSDDTSLANNKNSENIDEININVKNNVDINNLDENKSSPSEQNITNNKNSLENLINNINDKYIETKDNSLIIKNINYYSLERAIELLEKTIDIQDELDDDMEKEINDNDFEDIIFDLYINRYDNIKMYSNLYRYYIEKNDSKYINFINNLYCINTENKYKKLKTKINRCNIFYNSNLDINKTLITASFLAKMKTKDFNEFIKYIEKL